MKEHLIRDLCNNFDKIIQWELLCKQESNLTEEKRVALAEQVLAEPSSTTIVDWYDWWVKLYNIDGFELMEVLNHLNLAKIIHFQCLCKEKNAITEQEQVKIARDVLSWSPMDGAAASMGALIRNQECFVNLYKDLIDG